MCKAQLSTRFPPAENRQAMATSMSLEEKPGGKAEPQCVAVAAAAHTPLTPFDFGAELYGASEIDSAVSDRDL